MRWILQLITGLTVAGMAHDLPAQNQKFPYQAKVVVDEVYVRSGAGQAFYPTQRITRDATVTVRRHDPGGWYMIDPPKDSFSWIPKKYVRQTSAADGEIKEANVVVFVGSDFGDEANVWQRRMSLGERIRILDERDIPTLAGSQTMLKIVPPKREYRWLLGSAIVPVDGTLKQQHDNDPWKVPSNAIRPAPSEAVASPSPAASSSPVGPSQRLARLKRIREEQRRLSEIDQRFRTMILGDPSQWTLNEIHEEYLQLQNQVTHKPIAGQIDLRYPAIERYRQRKAKFDDFQQLTSATEKLDAELLTAQYGNGTQFGANTQFGVGTRINGAVASGPESSSGIGSQFDGSITFPGYDSNMIASPGPESVNIAGTAPSLMNSLLVPPGNPLPNAPSDQITQADITTPPISAASRYVGAGLVQRSSIPKDGSEFVLVSPTGKILAHLSSDGNVNLEEYVGKAVGLHGKRSYNTEIKSDTIEVSGLEPVRIRG